MLIISAEFVFHIQKNIKNLMIIRISALFFYVKFWFITTTLTIILC